MHPKDETDMNSWKSVFAQALLTACIAVAVCAGISLIPSCAKVASVGTSAIYTTPSTTISAGILVTFKVEPEAREAAELLGAGARRLGPYQWVLPSVTTDAQRLAVQSALLRGATLDKYKP